MVWGPAVSLQLHCNTVTMATIGLWPAIRQQIKCKIRKIFRRRACVCWCERRLVSAGPSEELLARSPAESTINRRAEQNVFSGWSWYSAWSVGPTDWSTTRFRKRKCYTVFLLPNQQQQQQLEQRNGVGESNTKQRYNSPVCHLFPSLPH